MDRNTAVKDILNQSRIIANGVSFFPTGAPIYEKQPACGFPPEAPADLYLKAPDGLFCPYQTVTYQCDIGGINEIEDQDGV